MNHRGLAGLGVHHDLEKRSVFDVMTVDYLEGLPEALNVRLQGCRIGAFEPFLVLALAKSQ